MLQNAQTGAFEFPVHSMWSNLIDESEAWRKSAILFDQSFHYDRVEIDGEMVRISGYPLYNANERAYLSCRWSILNFRSRERSSSSFGESPTGAPRSHPFTITSR